MTNDDTATKETYAYDKKLQKVVLRATLAFASIAALLDLNRCNFITQYVAQKQEQERVAVTLRDAARYLASEHYVPIGNGGALAAMHGHTSPERQKMLEVHGAIFWMKYQGQAPVRTFAEYRLKTEPDLSAAERERLETIVNRYRPRDW